jgi:O-antigen/teichoic acid export membrane protein
MIKNFAWDFLGKISGQVVSFVISVILTRLLFPKEFGIMGMAMSVITIAGVFVGLGFSRAIIQKPQIDKVQYNTVFLINTSIALVLTLVCFFGASPLSRFYEEPLIEPVFRVLSLTFLFNGLSLIPTSLLYKRMNFKMATIFSLSASISSGIVGVLMAYRGYGVWALVTQAVLNSFIALVLSWLYIGWWPGMTFSFPSVRPLWQYGSRMFLSGLLDVFFMRIDAFIIGKVFSPITLGYYTRAQSLDSIVKQLSSNSITSVLFPYISLHQENREGLTGIYKKYLHVISFLSIGLSAIFFLIASDLFTVLFTARWGYAAELFRLMALSGFAWPVSALMVSIIGGVGNSKAYLRLELLKKVVLLPVYLFGFLIGLKVFILGIVLAYLISVWLNALYVSRELLLTTKLQLLVIFSYVVIGAACVTGIHFLVLKLNEISPAARIALTVPLFAGSYYLLTYLFKLDASVSLKTVFRKTINFINSKRNTA